MARSGIPKIIVFFFLLFVGYLFSLDAYFCHWISAILLRVIVSLVFTLFENPWASLIYRPLKNSAIIYPIVLSFLCLHVCSCCFSVAKLSRLGAGGEEDDRGWNGWMASLTLWTWVWVNSGSWWWTGRSGVLRFIGSQRVGHDWATELKWTEVEPNSLQLCGSQHAGFLFSPLKFMSIESVMLSNHLILCHPLLLLSSIFPSIRVFSSDSALCIRWPKYWSFSFSISPSNE